jgi:hypothetical protein
VAAEVNASSTNNILYAYCPSNCGVAASYQIATLGSVGLGNAEISLRVTSSGQPRLLQPDINGYDYLACDSSCTSPASWTRTRAVNDGSRIDLGLEHENFAVGPNGQAAIVYASGAGTNLALCLGNCTQPTSWSSGVLVSGIVWSDIHLAWDGSGALHAAFIDISNPGMYKAIHLQCSSACSNIASWTGPILSTTSVSPAIGLSLEGNLPRVATWYADVGDPNYNQKMAVGACDANCGQSTSWRIAGFAWPDTTTPANERRVKLITTGGGAVIVSRGLGDIYAAQCTSNCTQTTGQWAVAEINSTGTMNAAFPLLQPCQYANWFFEYGMNAGVTAAGALVVVSGAHGRALSGNSDPTCSEGYNYDYQTVVQLVQ